MTSWMRTWRRHLRWPWRSRSRGPGHREDLDRGERADHALRARRRDASRRRLGGRRLALSRPAPVLIDEWQHHPPVWDRVRRAVDDHDPPGPFLLTGSVPRRAPASIRARAHRRAADAPALARGALAGHRDRQPGRTARRRPAASHGRRARWASPTTPRSCSGRAFRDCATSRSAAPCATGRVHPARHRQGLPRARPSAAQPRRAATLDAGLRRGNRDDGHLGEGA